MSTSADVMLQLRLLLHIIFPALTRTHVTVQTPKLIRVPAPTPTLTLIPISTHIRIPSITRILPLSSILMSVPLPHAPIHPHHGIPLLPFLLAG